MIIIMTESSRKKWDKWNNYSIMLKSITGKNIAIMHSDSKGKLIDIRMALKADYIICCNPELTKNRYPILADRILGNWESTTYGMMNYLAFIFGNNNRECMAEGEKIGRILRIRNDRKKFNLCINPIRIKEIFKS